MPLKERSQAVADATACSVADRRDALAASLDIELCDFCHEARDIHVGFDHRQKKCYIDWHGHMRKVNGLLTPAERKDVRQRLETYYKRLAELEDALMEIGNGI